MIALPGLLEHNALSKTETLAILKTFASHENQGLIPNFLGKTPEENAYNSVDASLFFAWAVQVYYTQTNDLKAIKKHFWPTLKHIFQHYKQGTLHNIKMNEKGLIEAGDEQTNLTWMDAMVNGKPSSPRYGAIVEINALWFNMLCFMQTLADTFKDSALEKEITPIIQILKKSFTQTFWDEDLGCLKDFVAQDKESRAIRPNQLFAISLPYSPITKTMAKKILKTVQDHLLTPYGLRTLSPNDPDYIGIYSGDSHHRDKAYHNGTVWPWLLGPFTQALLKTLPKAQTTKILEPCRKALKDHLFEAGIGTISEVFDGDAPHNPNGCISQAWSISEILRLSEFFNK